MIECQVVLKSTTPKNNFHKSLPNFGNNTPILNVLFFEQSYGKDDFWQYNPAAKDDW